MQSTATKDTRAAAEGDTPESAKFWRDEIEASGKRDKPWAKRARAVVDRYRDERDRQQQSERRTNILWSNTELLKAVLFQGLGNADVRRRNPKKGKDAKAAKTSALVLENSLSYCADAYDANEAVECAVEDMLLPGRGQCWIVYDAEVEEAEVDNEEEGDYEGEEAASAPEIANQSVRFDHVYWDDYRTSAGRKEADIWWKARRHQYSRDELKKYFPDDAAKIPLDAQVLDRPDQGNEDDDTFKRANVWEIWDKTKRERVYIAEGYETILRKDADPYKLRDFFPCPKALYGCKTTSTLTPIPEYTLYQDQAEELDQITTRLNRLIDALKRRGVYDASVEGADNQLSGLATANDNEFLPYKGFAALMEKGGLKNVFMTEDLVPIIQVVEKLYEQRATLVQTIYEVTGISDVIRGSSDPNETATAQRIKGQFGSLRIQKRQKKVQEFIRDLFRIKAEIIAEHFTREKLEEMTGIRLPLKAEVMQAQQTIQMLKAPPPPAQPPMPGMPPAQPQPRPQPSRDEMVELTEIAKASPWEDVEAILRSDDKRGYKVDIETEATAQVDEQAEKQTRIELLTVMTDSLLKLVPAAKQAPEFAPIVKELLTFALGAFKVGRVLEETFDDVFQTLVDATPPQQQEDPVAKAKAEEIQTKTKLAIEKAKGDQQVQGIKIKGDLAKQQMDIQGKQQEHALKREEMQQDMAMNAEANQMKRAEMAQNHRAQQAGTIMDLQAKRQQMAHADEEAKRKQQEGQLPL